MSFSGVGTATATPIATATPVTTATATPIATATPVTTATATPIATATPVTTATATPIATATATPITTPTATPTITPTPRPPVILHSFAADGSEGRDPYSGLAYVFEDHTSEYFYGTTSLGGPADLGTIFTIAPDGTFNVVHSFAGGNSDGANPLGGLTVDDSGITAYGTTSAGGAFGKGTAYKITSGAYELLHSFGEGSDGANPETTMHFNSYSGKFYGVTSAGGVNGKGTFFVMTPAGAVQVLHSFGAGSTNGIYPSGELRSDGMGNYYGTTRAGGQYDKGTVYKYNPQYSTFDVLHSFAGGSSDGEKPYGGLLATTGEMYGTTYAGGVHDKGTIFKITPEGVITLVHSFAGGDDGANPIAAMQRSLADLVTYYGTTSAGGAENKGTVFKLIRDGATDTVTMQHSFGAVGDGATPSGRLGSHGFTGTLYGTTREGGAYGNGTVFRK